MHQSGALQRVVWPFVAQLKVRQATQLLVDQWQQRIESLAVTIPPPLQKLRHLTWRLKDSSMCIT